MHLEPQDIIVEKPAKAVAVGLSVRRTMTGIKGQSPPVDGDRLT